LSFGFWEWAVSLPRAYRLGLSVVGCLVAANIPGRISVLGWAFGLVMLAATVLEE
jgi:hypothetical protein